MLHNTIWFAFFLNDSVAKLAVGTIIKEEKHLLMFLKTEPINVNKFYCVNCTSVNYFIILKCNFTLSFFTKWYLLFTVNGGNMLAPNVGSYGWFKGDWVKIHVVYSNLPLMPYSMVIPLVLMQWLSSCIYR